MAYFVKCCALVFLFGFFAVFSIVAAPLRAADCVREPRQCVLKGGLESAAFGLSPPVPIRVSQPSQRNFTYSTQGHSTIVKRYIYQSPQQVALPQAGQSRSRLSLTDGSTGRPGNLALSLKDGARLSMKLRETYMKIEYTLDF